MILTGIRKIFVISKLTLNLQNRMLEDSGEGPEQTQNPYGSKVLGVNFKMPLAKNL